MTRTLALAALLFAGACKSSEAEHAWTYHPIEGVRCGRGDDFGIGINKYPGAKRLLLFFIGGGACFDATSCDKSCDMKKQICAANLDGFGEKTWKRENRYPPGTVFDRSDPTNPFKKDSWVFMPYCTGDFHFGARRAEYGIEHQGWSAVTAMLEKIVPAFPELEHVVLYGVSAGGFGVVFNYEHVRAALPAKVKLDLINDSGPPFSRAWMPLQEEMQRSWASAKNAPQDCPDCATDWAKYFPYLANKYPGARFSLVSYEDDLVIAQGFGGPLRDRGAFARAIDAYIKEVLAPLPNVRVFIAPGRDHGVGKEHMSRTVAAGVTLADFLRRQVDGDPTWANAR